MNAKTASIVVEDALVIVEAKDVLFSTVITKLDVELTTMSRRL